MNLLVSLDGISCKEFITVENDFLKEGFSCVRSLETSFPSVTYTAHMNAITGENPEKHQIYENVLALGKHLERHELYDMDPFLSRKVIRSKTLFESAEKKGLKVLAIHWPLADAFTKSFVREKHCSHDQLQGIQAAIENDKIKMQTTLEAIGKGELDFLAVHFLQYDTIAHYFGVNHEKTLEAKNTLFEYMIEIKRQVEIEGNSNILIFSDHGLVDRSNTIYPNQFLDKNGFHQCINFNRMRLICDGSGSALYYSKLSHKENIYAFQILKSSEKVKGIYLTKCCTEKGNHVPKAIIDFTEGTCAEDILPGESPKYINLMGIHGHFSKNVERMNGFLMAYGNKIKRSEIIDKATINDIAKTMARLMEIEHKCTGGEIDELFYE